MKAAIEVMSSKEISSYKAFRVFIVCIPPHSSPKMKPLDQAFMGTKKTFCCQEVKQCLRSNPGRFVIVYQIGKLFGKYKQAATAATAANGSRAAGLSLVT
jgi:hypothetical protein